MKHLLRCVALLAALCAACASADGDSSLLLTITSDLRVPSELDRVSVNVAGQLAERDPQANLREQPLPRTLTLVHEGGPLGPFDVEVSGWLGTDLVYRERLAASFPERGRGELTIHLDRRCYEILCGGEQVCVAGVCTDPGTGLPDAAVDSGPDSARPDAGALDGGDDGSEAGIADAEAGAPDAEVPADAEVDATTPPTPGAPPVCAIGLPAAGDAYQQDRPVALRGSCTDPETGTIAAAGLRWRSLIDGELGQGDALDGALRTPGSHQLQLCASDPRDAALQGCAMVAVEVTTYPQPLVAIAGISQGGVTMSPYSASAPLDFSGSATGAGVTLRWVDDLQGELGTGASVTASAPRVGRHTVTLIARDRNGAEASARRTFVVVAAGETSLVSPLPTVNAELDRVGTRRVSTIASDAQLRAYVPSSSGVLYRFDGTQLAAAPTAAVGQPPLRDVVQDIQITDARTFLATAYGLTVCAFSDASGVGEPCSHYTRGNPFFNAQDIRSVLRMEGMGMRADALLLGTSSGLFLASSPDGSSSGTNLLPTRVISDMVALDGQAALATNGGLYLLNLTNQRTTRYQTGDGLPSNNVRSLALGSDGALWVGTSTGLARFADARFTSFTIAQGLPNNDVAGVAVERVATPTPARDVIWVATGAGVARLDTATSTITTFTSADGLPSDDVLAVHVLANGTKLFGTADGLAHYVGP